MGQDIASSHFTEQDYAAFTERLRAETALLDQWLADGYLEQSVPTGGFELEVWLVGPDMAPAGRVEALLERLRDPLVVPELATFNAEINGTAQPLRGDALSQLAAELTATLGRCSAAAAGLDTRIGLIGILPTVAPRHLTVTHMTPRARYRALNDRILALRHERPLTLDIQGRDRLTLEWQDVMLEAAATSFQIHLKVAAAQGARLYNASKILSAPMVAIGANSPFLFGRDLWDETRVPLFEQAVSVGGPILQERVNFGFRYAKRSIMETFQANLDRYPVLMPQLMDEPLERLAHLRLHNGTIWRWNRPLIGFDESGRPHLRIEHRVLPFGPNGPGLHRQRGALLRRCRRSDPRGGPARASAALHPGPRRLLHLRPRGTRGGDPVAGRPYPSGSRYPVAGPVAPGPPRASGARPGPRGDRSLDRHRRPASGTESHRCPLAEGLGRAPRAGHAGPGGGLPGASARRPSRA